MKTESINWDKHFYLFSWDSYLAGNFFSLFCLFLIAFHRYIYSAFREYVRLFVYAHLSGQRKGYRNDLCGLAGYVSFSLILKGNNLKCSIITQYQQWKFVFRPHTNRNDCWTRKKVQQSNSFTCRTDPLMCSYIYIYIYPLSRQQCRRKTCVRRYRSFNNIICTLIVVFQSMLCIRIFMCVCLFAVLYSHCYSRSNPFARVKTNSTARTIRYCFVSVVCLYDDKQENESFNLNVDSKTTACISVLSAWNSTEKRNTAHAYALSTIADIVCIFFTVVAAVSVVVVVAISKYILWQLN